MQLFPLPNNQPPKNTFCVEVATPSGLRLRAAYAVPRGAKGTVLILNGRAEFIERYFEMMNDLVKRGFAVATFDWRGQGGSDRLLADPKRGHIDNFAQFDEDIDAIFAQVLVPHCPKPFYGLGHSTGGHMLLRALRGKKWLQKAVAVSPLLGLPYGKIPEPVGRFLAAVTNLLGASRQVGPGAKGHALTAENFKNNLLTSDKRRFERDCKTLVLHPELEVGGPTFGWIRAAMKSIDELQAWPELQAPSCPTLVVVAGRDQVVDTRGTIRFLERARGFSSITISDSRHEIMNETNDIRERFLAAFEGFVNG